MWYLSLERSGKEKENDAETNFLALFVVKLSEFIVYLVMLLPSQCDRPARCSGPMTTALS